MRAWGRRLLRATVSLAVTALACYLAFLATPPRWWVDPAKFARPKDAVTVLDRHGAALRTARVGGVDRRWVALKDVSKPLVDAVLAAEDARFYSHKGVDARAVVRATVDTLVPGRSLSGGSTITQQLVKLVYGRPHGRLDKPFEILRAAALERIFTKEEILEQYLNRLPYGDRIEGVERASESYFGRPAKALGTAEAALIAGIPRAPSVTEPRRHLPAAIRRRDVVLGRMAGLGMIDEEARSAAAATAPLIVPTPRRADEAPRFVDQALFLYRRGMLDKHSGTVTTSLDLELQHRVEDILRATVLRLTARGVTNGAAIVLDHESGDVLAYVGAARRGPGNPGGELDLLTAPRQPGSTLKPFVYELFFEHGGTAASVLDDLSLVRTGANGSSFEAKDYDGAERGPVRARVALASSLNLAALDAAGRVGQDAVWKRLKALGLKPSGGADRYGAAAVLGGVDVAPLDLAAAYATLARGGTRITLSYGPSKKAAEKAERARAKAKDGDKAVLDPAAVAVVTDVLEDPRARADGFGESLEDLAGGRFALKTGTSAGFRDAWAAAFTGSVTVVVWIGDPGSHPLGGVSGFEAAAPVAARILGAAREVLPPSEEHAIAKLDKALVCADTGLRPGAGCRHTVQESFAAGTAPTKECEAHDAHGDVMLPARYAEWIRRTKPAGVSDKPAALEKVSAAPTVATPRDGSRLLVDPARGPTRIPLRATVGSAEAPGATFEVDGVKLSDPSWTAVPGEHVLVATWQGQRSAPAKVRVETP